MLHAKKHQIQCSTHRLFMTKRMYVHFCTCVSVYVLYLENDIIHQASYQTVKGLNKSYRRGHCFLQHLHKFRIRIHISSKARRNTRFLKYAKCAYYYYPFISTTIVLFANSRSNGWIRGKTIYVVRGHKNNSGVVQPHHVRG